MKGDSERDLSSTHHPFLVPDIRPDRMGSSVGNVSRPRPTPAASEVENFCRMRAHRRTFVVIEALTTTRFASTLMPSGQRKCASKPEN